MRLQRTFLVAIAIGALVAVGGCSNNRQGDDASPVFLEVSFETINSVQNIRTNNTDKLRVPTTTVKNIRKNPSGGGGAFLDVRLDTYTVRWERMDGGTVVPQTESFPANVIVPDQGSSTLTDYGFMSVGGWQLPPIDQLYPFNGGLDRQTGRVDIRLRAIVTFTGHTMAGQPASGSGSFDVEFVYQ